MVRCVNTSKNEIKLTLNEHDDALLDELDNVLVRMGRIMASRHFGPECCPETVTMPQALLLRAMEMQGAVKMSEVAALLAIKPPAASAAVASLEREGYVVRTVDTSDRRVTLVTPTSAGLDALHEAETRHRALMRRYFAVLSEEDIRKLIDIHHKLIGALTSNQI